MIHQDSFAPPALRRVFDHRLVRFRRPLIGKACQTGRSSGLAGRRTPEPIKCCDDCQDCPPISAAGPLDSTQTGLLPLQEHTGNSGPPADSEAVVRTLQACTGPAQPSWGVVSGVCRPVTEVGRIRIQNGRSTAVTHG